MPKLTIDGMEIEVEPGTSILQAAETLGIEIPRFCYHDRLSVPANCRMCLVEVEGGPPKPQASCALACADGMAVKTDSPMVDKARKGVMEMLLINHPLDCPICDQGGECDLQDQAVAYGFDRSRYHENKRAVPNKEIGPLIKTIMTRCIQCTRCVRFADEIAGKSELGLMHRGEDVEIDTFVEKAVDSELSGNLIDVCPVGALTSKPYAFKARSWELVKTESIDVHDALGCNIRVDSRGGEVMRVLPRLHEDINEEWIDDKTRFACDGLKYQRLDQPYIRDEKSGKLRPAIWEEALAVVAGRLKNTKSGKVAALAGDLCALEDMVALKDLMAAKGSANLECRLRARYDVSARGEYLFNSTITGIEQADAILLVGTNPRHEAALVNARIRKAWRQAPVKIGLIGPACELTYPYTHIGTDKADIAALAAGKHDFAAILKKAERPMMIIGEAAFNGPDGPAVQAQLRALAEEFGVIDGDWNGYNILHSAASRAGALDIGFYSDLQGGFDAADLSGMDFVYLLGADEFTGAQIPDKAFVVYQGHHGDKGAARADVILPGAAYTEKNGLYVNTEGRVQQARRAVHPPGQAREDWKIIRALAGQAGYELPYDTHLELYGRIEKQWPHLAQIDEAPSSYMAKLSKYNKALYGDFDVKIEDFYLTNIICKASPTMAECSRVFTHKEEQAERRMEAAE